MADTVYLIVNAGSSSVRLSLFRAAAEGVELLREVRHEHCAPVPAPLRTLLEEEGVEPALIAHRFVHGGRLSAPAFIDGAVRAEIERCAVLAPLHNPPALAWHEVSRTLFGPTLPQLAVFDTAFHADLPARAAIYPLPRAVTEKHGLRRYGFHGLAHEAMWRAWCALHPERSCGDVDPSRGGRIITLQLGAGCSAAAIDSGRSIDTSMGYTPLEGLMMATRGGDIDPGLLLQLQRTGIDPDTLERMLTRESGLLGVSGVSGDFRALLASREPDAELAVEAFCYRVRKYIGAYIAVLGGVDGIVFGGGVGEHLPVVRRRILCGLDALGIELDERRNEEAVAVQARISADTSAVEVWVQPVDEARVIAEAAWRLTTRQ